MRSARSLLSWPKPIPILLLIALGLRLLLAGTTSIVHYPDEWYQSAELANLLVHGQATYVQEIGLHMRNLSWPALLSLPLLAAQAIDPGSPWWKLFSLQAFAALLDFAMLLALLSMARRRGWDRDRQLIVVMLSGLAWFAVQFSVKLSAEHAAAVLFVLAFAFIECPHGRRRSRPAWVFSGILSMFGFAAKYPAGLLVAGIAIAMLLRRDRLRFRYWGAGALAGLVAISIPDAVYYGRPLESLWMYLAYNVLTPTSTAMFGAQPLSEYLDFFRTRWFHPAFFIGPLLVPAVFYGWGRALRRREFWAVAAVIYLIPHLMVEHKEARFLLPLEPLWILAAIPGLSWAWNWVRASNASLWITRAAVLFAVVGAAQTLVVVRGQWGTLQGSYLQVGRHLKTHQNACLVMTARPPSVALMPERTPIAHFNALRHQSMADQITSAELIYWQSPPACQEGAEILLNVEKFETAWENWGCTPLLGQTLASWGLSGVWYGCPHTLIRLFTRQRTEAPVTTHFGRFEILPSLSQLRAMKPIDLLRLGDENVSPPECSISCFKRGRNP